MVTQHMLLKVISIDDIKSAIPGYDPAHADEFHEESAKLANKLFDAELKKHKNKEIILLCGGSASSKTEFLAQHLSEYFDGLVFDSTFSTKLGAKIKLKKILESDNIPKIYFILPKSFNLSFRVFKNRERKIPEHRFFETHSGARQTVLWVAENFSQVEIRIYSNNYENDQENDFLPFEEKEFGAGDRKGLIKFLKNFQVSRKEISAKITSHSS